MEFNQQQVPGSKAGSFPRHEIKVGESVLYEGKPSFVAFALFPMLWFMFLLALIIVIAVYEFYALAIFCSIGMMIVAVAPFLYYFLMWNGTSFAITDKRVLLIEGGFNRSIKEMPLSVVTGTVLNQSFLEQLGSSASIGFSTSGAIPGFKWPAVQNGEAMRHAFEDLLARYRVAPPPPMTVPVMATQGVPQYGMPAYQVPPPTGIPQYGMPAAQQPQGTAPQYGAPSQTPSAQPARMFCPTCGKAAAQSSAFCQFCGAKF